MVLYVVFKVLTSLVAAVDADWVKDIADHINKNCDSKFPEEAEI